MSERADGLVLDIAGDGPPLLLVHAGIADRTMWDPVWEELAGRFRVIRFDQRGFGESEDPTAAWHPHEDVATVIAAAGAERAMVIGASMGGSAALELALERPELVDRLVTVCSSPDGLETDPSLESRFAEIDALVAAGDLDSANEREMQIWMDGTRAPGACDPALREPIGRINRALLDRQPALPEPFDVEPAAFYRLGGLEVPLLVVTAEYDQPSISEGSRLMADRSGSRLVEIPGAAHLPSVETPERFCEAVLPFLAGTVA